MKNKSSNLADKLFPELHEQEVEILDIPPEKRKLNTETYDFTVSTIVEYLKQGHMKIPEFQRGYVWNRSQASRLIESLIIQCPIPVIFLAQNSDETLSVIDGNQRLNSIKLFMDGAFDLQGLTAYPELDGFGFDELDPRFKRHILNRTVRCIVILKDTHPQIKFDVFERLNTGSVKLNAQEIRHGIYHGSLMLKVEELAKLKLWKTLSGLKADKRMKSDELILRYFALSEDWRNYRKPLSNFISNFSEANQNSNEEELGLLSQRFKTALEHCDRIFGDHAFKSFSNLHEKPKFNAALFDAQMIAITELDLTEQQIEGLEAQKTDILDGLLALINSSEYSKIVSKATTDRNPLLQRIRGFRAFMEQYI